MFCTFGPNLANQGWMGRQLLRGRAQSWRMAGRTHTGNNNTTRRPKRSSGKNTGCTPQMKVNAPPPNPIPPNAGECPHLLKMFYQTLMISIWHRTVNTLEMSECPPPPTKEGQCPSQTQVSVPTLQKCVIQLWRTRQTLLWKNWNESKMALFCRRVLFLALAVDIERYN